MSETGFCYYVRENISINWECTQKLRFFKTEEEAIGHAKEFVEKSISDGTPHNTAAVFGIDSDGCPKPICIFMAQWKHDDDTFTVIRSSPNDYQDGQAEEDDQDSQAEEDEEDDQEEI
jgi:hypothetical protein